MRNLLCTRRRQLFCASSSLPVSFVTIEPTDTLFVALGPSDDTPSIEIRHQTLSSNSVKTVACWNLPTSERDEIVDMQFLSELGLICLCMRKGDIIFVPEDPTHEEEKIEIVGTIEHGILAASWAPDEQLLCIVTGNSSFLLMTKSLSVVAESPLSINDLSLSCNQVSVGWGRADTQFRGKRAKALPRDPTLPEKLDQGVISPLDDRKVRISWRGDSAYVALSRVEDEKRRAVRVYSREGIFDSVSEPVDGLEGQLGWRPSGNIISSIQRHEDKLQTVFFERNGLRHGEFNLYNVISLDEAIFETIWNVDSTVLAISLKSKVQLWTMSNYHYYLKQEICFQSGLPIDSICWNPEKPLELLIKQGDFIEIRTFVWSTFGSNDYGLVPVIDGKTLKLTPLQHINIPPPMSFQEVNLETSIKHVSVSPSSFRIAVLRQGCVDIIEWDALNSTALKSIGSPSVLKSIPIVVSARQVVLVDDEHFILLVDEAEETRLMLFSSSQLSSIAVSGVSFLTRLQDSGDTAIYQTDTGLVHSLRYSSENLELGREITRYPFQANHLEAIDVDGEILVIALSESGKLYANHRQLSTSCTSFVISKPFLVYTVTQQLIGFVLLERLLDGILHSISVFMLESQPLDNDLCSDERTRPIERGARIVSVLPIKCAVVLQMPRGNLETITPRILVLAKVRSLIDQLEYGLAFDTCRTHRIDLNILCDYRFDQFMNNVTLFVKQISKVEYLDLFLSSLKEEDVTISMYKDVVSNESNKASTVKKSARVCDAILAVLEHDYMVTHLQCMITAYCSKSPADMEAALSLISKLRSEGSPLVDRAIEHICFLADVNKLFSCSLGLYDLELAMLIANNSQKDPKEFMPFLQQLHKMDTDRRQYTINDHLKRYSKALDNLLSIPEAFEEAKEYTKTHKLYLYALKEVKYDALKHASILELYADELFSEKNYHEAGLAYESVKKDAKALDSYLLAGSWRECLSIASRLSSPSKTIANLSLQLSEMMLERREYVAAATIRLEYLDDLEGAAEALCKGNEYTEACRIVTMKGLPELVHSVVKPRVVEGFAMTSQLISDLQAQYAAQSERLRVLRRKKTQVPDSVIDEGENDIADNISLAPTDMSTSATLFTRYTGRSASSSRKQSSKSKRREERKRVQGKKGTIYEEDYLVNSIGRLVVHMNSSRDEINRLLFALVRFGLLEQASDIQRRFKGLISDVKNGIGEVFSGVQDVVEDMGESMEREPPHIEDFPGLLFLT